MGFLSNMKIGRQIALLPGARPAETVAGETAAIAHCKAQAIIGKQAYADLKDDLDALRKGRKGALKQLTTRASTAEDARRAADLARRCDWPQPSIPELLHA
jgi:hypothetical protein